ncbi:MAG TPA: glutamate--tRNA ligase family protein, partial [bacterium]|nr:glutamate--tRNA ligase family protein [bacterium]
LPPKFAHMSMTLGPDRTRLSKRHGATSLRDYREKGFLSDAMFNYLALLGWSSKDNQEIFSKQELIKEFSIEACNKSNAVFDPAKLLWMNSQYMKMKPAQELMTLSMPFLEKAGYKKPDIEKHQKTIEKLIEIEKEKFKTLQDIPERIGPFISDNINWDLQLLKKFKTPDIPGILSGILVEINKTASFEKSTLENTIRKFCEEKKVKPGELFQILRFALTGTTKGPGLFELMEILGRDVSIKRIDNFLHLL